MPQNEIRPALQEYLNCPDEQYVTEAAIIGRIVRELLAANGRVTNRAIILALIDELESGSDLVHPDVLRNCLEIVVGHTPDDIK